ncbi:FkbM family methyltransferase [Paracraurococcus lichenis]|uniref:FkbM family methyltransferase n=1 Tax=Paracraurococcus lichenis TaxID=3064888 RepID=A0ABT9EDT7_9PROT|nr:FkbM family methyltransferase [Paracraurococcus sp. LOR1-02]MDO9714045.1 FkbM family methyltransferase [Paracraurococcus sp. LOR1-02]
MTFVSYAQNFEDVMLRRAFRDVAEGFYVDVGAWYPELHSVTKALYDAGWHGINIEPGPIFAQLAAARPRDINLQVALGEQPCRMPLHVFRVGNDVLGTSSLHGGPAPDIPGEVVEETIEVEVTTLARVLDEHAPGQHIHVLKIDAEGAEAAILRSTDWRRYRPELLVIEATRPQSQDRTDGEWTPLLTAAGYHHVWFDGLNAWFLREESMARAEAFRAPPNIFDDFRVHDPEGDRARAAAEAWGRSLEEAVQHGSREQERLQTLLQASQQHATALEAALQRARSEHAALEQRNATLEQSNATLEQRNAMLERSVAQTEDELRRTVTARAAAAACAAAFEQETAELKARLAGMANDLEAAQATAAAARAEAHALLAERWRLTNRLEIENGPRVLTALLPLARVLRRIAWRGRIPAPVIPPEIEHLVGMAPSASTPPPAPVSAPPGGPDIGHAASTGNDPRLARSVETALLTIALRSEPQAEHSDRTRLPAEA